LKRPLLADATFPAPNPDITVNISVQTEPSAPQQNATEREPDLFISHVESGSLCPNETNPAHFRHRAGKKILHQCGVLIGEIKRAPDRDADLADQPAAHRFHVMTKLATAQKELYEYCSAYFTSYSQAKTVIAFAAAGPFWDYATVKRDEVPTWDKALKQPKPTRNPERTLESFKDRFLGDFLVLGTVESDEELTNINRTTFSAKLADGHHRNT
jgi:hypothetical protein